MFFRCCFTLVLLPSCQPRLAQHHRLLLSIPSVFSVPQLFFPSFSDTSRTPPDAQRTFLFLYSFFLRSQSVSVAASAVVPHQPGREKHPSTTTRRQGANTATPILTPTVSLLYPRRRFSIFSMSACLYLRGLSSLVACTVVLSPCLLPPPL